MLPVAPVKELFVTFSKALRAFQLYDENNPVYQRFVSALHHAAQLFANGQARRCYVGGIDSLLNKKRLYPYLYHHRVLFGENKSFSICICFHISGSSNCQ